LDLYTTSGIWAGAILTLIVMSFLYKENPLFRLAEHIVVGLGAGYFAVWGMKNVNDIALTGVQRGDYSYFLPMLLGVLFFLRMSKKYSWLSRWSIAVIVGVSTGLFVRGTIDVQLIGQILAAGKSIASTDILQNVNNLLAAVLTVCTITYFIYTREQKGPLTVTSRIGRYGMMVAFGAIFGGTVVSRMATMIGVIQFLLFEWLGIR